MGESTKSFKKLFSSKKFAFRCTMSNSTVDTFFFKQRQLFKLLRENSRRNEKGKFGGGEEFEG